MSNATAGENEERLRPLAEQWPYIRFLGLGAWWAWIWLSYNSINIMMSFPTYQQPSLVLAMYLLSTAGIGASTLFSAFNWKKASKFVGKRAFVIACGILASVSTILLGLSAMVGAGAFFALAALLTGVGTSALCLKVGSVYGSTSLGDSLTAGALSLVFAAFLYFTGIGIPDEWSLFFIAALPTVSALMLTMAPPTRSPRTFPSKASTPPARRSKGSIGTSSSDRPLSH